MPLAGLAASEDGKLALNIAHFARALRKAGLPVGTGRVIDAIRAVEAVGFTDKRDFYFTLQACFVSRPEHRAVFAQVFRLFWRDPQFCEHMMSLLPRWSAALERARPSRRRRSGGRPRRCSTAPSAAPGARAARRREVEVDATLTFSADERLKRDGLRADVGGRAGGGAAGDRPARAAGAGRSPAGGRGSTRAGGWPTGAGRCGRRCAPGGDVQALVTRARRTRWPNLVALCDISGSMSSYSRMLLHFLHAAANAKGAGWAQVHAFTFGTRLTNITRHLRRRDVDAALEAAGREALDWEGGTRIGACLHAFNRDWSRRVLGQGAVVLLITDGLDRDDPERLAAEMERLHLSARRLIWLNPLLRWDGFTPRARGIRAMLPHVDGFRACHNLASLEELVAELNRADDPQDRARIARMLAAG